VENEADIAFLRAFGAAQLTDVQHGMEPRVRNLFREAGKNREKLAAFLPILAVVSREYPPAWRHMVSLYQSSSEPNKLEKAKRAIEKYLQLSARTGDHEGRREAWKTLATLRKETDDYIGEVRALLEASRLPDCPIEDVSYAARKLLYSLKTERATWDKDERLLAIEEVASRMETRLPELYPNDFGRLAWLFLSKNDRDSAVKFTRQGLYRDRHNDYLGDLAARLGVWI
jgi:hypothetical protein